jgi:ribonuclease R
MSVKKKKVLQYLFSKDYKPATFEGLQKALNVTGDEDIKELYLLLESMEKEGSLVKTSQGRYTPLRGLGLYAGELQGHSQGFAFLIPDAPGEQDVFISGENLGGAMHKDRVLVRLLKKSRVKKSHDGRKREGEVIRILKRSNFKIVATYQGNRHGGTALPDDRRLFREISIPGGRRRARPGDKIVVEITRRPDRINMMPEGEIIEVIGAEGEPGVDITSIQKKYGLPSAFPAKVLREVEKLDEKHILEALEGEGRRDLRSLPVMTIDDADARDLDDAISLERIEHGYRLGVHIADVGYYVQEGSAVDREAAKRATSVYLPDRVIPMLPPILSNMICSLNPGSPRLAISVFMELDSKGELEKYSFLPSIIISDRRLTYNEVNQIIDGDKNLREHHEKHIQTLLDMDSLARILKENRIKRGALDFDFPEAKIKLNEDGRPLEIQIKRGGHAESIIEEFMLLCNEVIAAHFFRLKTPFIYRVHERPDEDKLYILRDFLSIFNIKFKGDLNRIASQQFQRIMMDVKGTPMEKVVNYVLLRSLPQARYSEASSFHFGLAAPIYTHFTSPIRRYPDLLVHRILRSSINGALTRAKSRKLTTLLPQLARHASEQERVALEAERECVDLKKVEFMEGKEGSEHVGTISGVTSFGFFVELENTVEGLVHVTKMEDDYYFFDEKRYSLVGEHGGKVYRLGDSVKVCLEKVDKETRTIYFSIATQAEFNTRK